MPYAPGPTSSFLCPNFNVLFFTLHDQRGHAIQLKSCGPHNLHSETACPFGLHNPPDAIHRQPVPYCSGAYRKFPPKIWWELLWCALPTRQLHWDPMGFMGFNTADMLGVFPTTDLFCLHHVAVDQVAVEVTLSLGCPIQVPQICLVFIRNMADLPIIHRNLMYADLKEDKIHRAVVCAVWSIITLRHPLSHVFVV